MRHFWLQFAVQEAIAVASAVVATDSKLTPAQKSALEQLIQDAQAVSAAFGV